LQGVTPVKSMNCTSTVPQNIPHSTPLVTLYVGYSPRVTTVTTN